MSALAEAIAAALREAPLQFAEIADAHRESAWRDFLKAWGEVRAAGVLKRDAIGRYYVAGGAAEAVADATRAEDAM